MSRKLKNSKWHLPQRSQDHEKIISIFTFVLLLATGIMGAWWFLKFAGPKPAKVWYDVRAAKTNPIQLPRDDGPHDLYTEWWYYNGHLRTESGATYSFHYAVFLLNSLINQLVIHASLTDHQSGHRFSAQKRTGGNPSAGSNNEFRFRFEDWEMTGSNGNDKLKVATGEFSFNLGLNDPTGPVYQAENGILDFNELGKSFYYSRPRMEISGLLKLPDTIEKVTGQAWFDHQWGDFRPSSLGWDWFALQFENGADIMLYKLYDNLGNSVLFAGTYTEGGVTEYLSSADFTAASKDRWASKKSNIIYPMNWSLTIPKKNIRVSVDAVVENSEFDAQLTTYNLYWEGAVVVTGTHKGVGFVELSGYKPNKDISK